MERERERGMGNMSRLMEALGIVIVLNGSFQVLFNFSSSLPSLSFFHPHDPAPSLIPLALLLLSGVLTL
jgi:hypothetical protein